MFNKLVLVFSCLCLGCGAGVSQRTACPAVEVRAGADAGADSTPLVTSADITGARASEVEGTGAVNFDITDAAAKRVQDYSRVNVGRTIALAVDGKVKGTPKIMSPLTGKGFRIDGFTRAEAEQLASAMTACKR